MDYSELRDQWSKVADEMEEVARSFMGHKGPSDTAKALDRLGDEFKQLATDIKEYFK